MSIKEIALALHTFEKKVQALSDPKIQAAFMEHIQEMHTMLINERLLNNEIRNFQLSEIEPLQETSVPKTSRSAKAKKK